MKSQNLMQPSASPGIQKKVTISHDDFCDLIQLKWFSSMMDKKIEEK